MVMLYTYLTINFRLSMLIFLITERLTLNSKTIVTYNAKIEYKKLCIDSKKNIVGVSYK